MSTDTIKRRPTVTVHQTCIDANMLMFELPMDKKAGTSLKRAKPVEEFVNYKSRVRNYGVVLRDMLCADWDIVPTEADGEFVNEFYSLCQQAKTWTQKSGGTNRGEHYLFASPKYQPPLAAYKLYSATRTALDNKGNPRPLHLCDIKSGPGGYIVGPGSIVLAESGPYVGTRAQYRMKPGCDVAPVLLSGDMLQSVKRLVSDASVRNAPAGTPGTAGTSGTGAEYDWLIMFRWMCLQIEDGSEPDNVANEAFDDQANICPGHIPSNPYSLETLKKWALKASMHTEPIETLPEDFVFDFGPFPKEGTTMAIPTQTPSTDPKFKFNGTDDDNAVLFAQMAKGKFVYSKEESAWYEYISGRWTAGSKETALQLARKVARKQDKLAASIEDDSKRMNAQKNAKNAHSRKSMEAMVALAKGALLVSVLDFDTNPDVLNVANGTLNLKTGELLPHKPEDMHSKIAPVIFDPSAKAPRWEQFLREVHLDPDTKEPDEDAIIWFQKFMGYSTTGHTKEQCMLLCHGEDGENGKSTEDVALAKVLGPDYAISLDPAIILSSAKDSKAPDSSMARLRGARFVSLSETDTGTMNLATFKRLTGDEIIPSRDLYTKATQFKATHTFKMLCNYLPTITDMNDATWSRLRTLPYIAKFRRGTESADTSLTETLAGESSGILNWLLAGSMSWYKEKLGTCRSIIVASEDYRQDQNQLTPFVTDCYTEVAIGRIKGSDMYATYKSWAAINGMKVLSSKDFHKNMMRTYTRKKMLGIDTYFGLVLIVKV